MFVSTTPSIAAPDFFPLAFDLTMVDAPSNWANEVPSKLESHAPLEGNQPMKEAPMDAPTMIDVEPTTRLLIEEKKEAVEADSASVEPTREMNDSVADTWRPHAPPVIRGIPLSAPPAAAVEDERDPEPSSNLALELGYSDFGVEASEEATLGGTDTAPSLPATFRAPIVPDDLSERTIEDEAIVDEAIGAHQRYLFTIGIAVLGLIAGVTTALLSAS